MKKLTKKHIFKCMLEDKPIELWLPTPKADDPVNIASHELMIEHGIYVHHVKDAQSDMCLRVTHPIRLFWPRTPRNFFTFDELHIEDGVKYNVRVIEVGDTIPLNDYEESD